VNKILFIVLDGAAGKPCKTLGGKTELEAAKTPNIDSLLSKSVNGLMHVVGKNIAPQSDVAGFALMGYNPFNVPARGIVEAIGSGLNYTTGEVALRCNLAVVKGDKIIQLRLVDFSDSEGREVEELINNGVSLDAPFTFKHTKDYRGVLVLHKKLSDQVTNTHPGYIRERIGTELVSVAVKLNELVIKPCRALNPEAGETADIINDFSKQASEVLTKAGIKANYILTRDAGSSMPKLETFFNKHKIDIVIDAEMPVELGMAKLLGIDTLKPSKDLRVMAKEVINKLNDTDAVYVHIKGPDKYGHLGDATGKVREIERIDRDFIGELLKIVDLKNTTICITADHATPSVMGGHSDDPVPYLITDSEVSSGHFCERDVKQFFIEGKELMSKVISIAKQ